MARSHRSGGSSRSSFSSSRSSSRSFSSRSSHSSSRRHHTSYSSPHSSTHHHTMSIGFGTGLHHHSHTSIHVSGPAAFLSFPIFILFVSIIVMILFSNSISSMKDQLYDIENSYTYYQNMILRAESDPRYQTTAEITYVGYEPDYDKYYIEYAVYSYNTNNSTGHSYKFEILCMESFAMYSRIESLALNVGDEINIAINHTNVKYATDSINMDYKNISLEQDAEYCYCKDTIKTQKLISTISKLSAGISILIIVILLIKIKKKSNDKNTEINTSATPSTLENASSTDQPQGSQTKFCAYCGAQLASDQAKCPLCGAVQKKY